VKNKRKDKEKREFLLKICFRKNRFWFSYSMTMISIEFKFNILKHPLQWPTKWRGTLDSYSKVLLYSRVLQVTYFPPFCIYVYYVRQYYVFQYHNDKQLTNYFWTYFLTRNITTFFTKPLGNKYDRLDILYKKYKFQIQSHSIKVYWRCFKYKLTIWSSNHNIDSKYLCFISKNHKMFLKFLKFKSLKII